MAADPRFFSDLRRALRASPGGGASLRSAPPNQVPRLLRKMNVAREVRPAQSVFMTKKKLDRVHPAELLRPAPPVDALRKMQLHSRFSAGLLLGAVIGSAACTAVRDCAHRG